MATTEDGRTATLDSGRPSAILASGRPTKREGGRPATLIVDAANVIGSVPDGWWRDRAGATERLRDALSNVARSGLPGSVEERLRDGPINVVLVVEGKARSVAPTPTVTVVAAPDSGDDEIVRQVATHVAQGWCAVATADRKLAERVQDLGAIVVGPRSVDTRPRRGGDGGGDGGGEKGSTASGCCGRR